MMGNHSAVKEDIRWCQGPGDNCQNSCVLVWQGRKITKRPDAGFFQKYDQQKDSHAFKLQPLSVRLRPSHSFPVTFCAAQSAGLPQTTLFRTQHVIYKTNSVSVEIFTVKEYSLQPLGTCFSFVLLLIILLFKKQKVWTKFLDQPQLPGIVCPSGFAFRFKKLLSNFGFPCRYLEISRVKRQKVLIFSSSQSYLWLLTELPPSALCSYLVLRWTTLHLAVVKRTLLSLHLT